MRVSETGRLLSAHPFLAGIDPAALEEVGRCASSVRLRAGEHLFREDEPADSFYLLLSGRVSIQARTPTRAVVLDSAHGGDAVGWSWLVPPHRWTVDAVATEDTTALALDGPCLRRACLEDPELAGTLLQRVVLLMAARLHSARVRLLDLYGSGT